MDKGELRKLAKEARQARQDDDDTEALLVLDDLIDAILGDE